MTKTGKRLTIDQRTSGDPLNPNDTTATMIKPGELVDVVEMVHLTLLDRRTFNVLVANAWERIDQDVDHCIPKVALRGSHDSNDRLRDTIRRLMAAVVEVRIQRDGKWFIRSTHLLGDTDREEGDDETGVLYYSFPKGLRSIIRQSTTFARLRTEVMFCFQSKYGLALYEMVQKRGHLQKHVDEFAVDEFRQLLGVPKNKLVSFHDFRRFAIEPAVAEVNALGDYRIEANGIRHGRSITKVRLVWFPKDEQGLRAAYSELQNHKATRKVVTGTVERWS